MLLEKYENFLNLGVKELTDYLAVRGFKTFGKKVGELLKRFETPDPNRIEIEKRLDNLTLWPLITKENIFAFTLHKKDFNTI